MIKEKNLREQQCNGICMLLGSKESRNRARMSLGIMQGQSWRFERARIRIAFAFPGAPKPAKHRRQTFRRQVTRSTNFKLQVCDYETRVLYTRNLYPPWSSSSRDVIILETNCFRRARQTTTTTTRIIIKSNKSQLQAKPSTSWCVLFGGPENRWSWLFGASACSPSCISGSITH